MDAFMTWLTDLRGWARAASSYLVFATITFFLETPMTEATCLIALLAYLILLFAAVAQAAYRSKKDAHPSNDETMEIRPQA